MRHRHKVHSPLLSLLDRIPPVHHPSSQNFHFLFLHHLPQILSPSPPKLQSDPPVVKEGQPCDKRQSFDGEVGCERHCFHVCLADVCTNVLLVLCVQKCGMEERRRLRVCPVRVVCISPTRLALLTSRGTVGRVCRSGREHVCVRACMDTSVCVFN